MGGDHGHAVSQRTFGAIDAAYEKVAPTHPQGGGHAPRYRLFGWGNHGGYLTWKWLGITLTGQEEQARWVQRINDNPFFPKSAVIHQVNGNTPGIVTTANHLRASVPVSKFTGVVSYVKFGLRPWWTEFIMQSAFRYAAWGAVGAGAFIWAIRYQYASAAKFMNKSWGTNLSVPTWTL